MVVLVTSKANADESWAGFVNVGGETDSLTIRRANVLLMSDGGMSRDAKTRARRAMAALPNRGHDVDVLDDR